MTELWQLQVQTNPRIAYLLQIVELQNIIDQIRVNWLNRLN